MSEATMHDQLPRTWRPRTARLVLGLLAALTVGTMTVLAFILPMDWTIVDRLGVILFGGVCALGMWFLARGRITATEEGLRVVNIVRTWVLTWPEVVDVRMPEGEPWPTIDLADGTSIVAMGIQRSDGPRAETELAALRELVHTYGEAQEPGTG
jgi:hypothetical protein